MVGNAEELPFNDNKFDVYTIAFGIRNVTHIDQVSRGNMSWDIQFSWVFWAPRKEDTLLYEETSVSTSHM